MKTTLLITASALLIAMGACGYATIRTQREAQRLLDNALTLQIGQARSQALAASCVR